MQKTTIIKNLNNEEEFIQKLNNEEHFVVYKHSSTCKLSATAKQEILKYLESNTYTGATHKIPFYDVLVLEQRPLSNKISEITNITHESPQILQIKNKEVVWNASHKKITTENLEKNLK